MSEKNVVTVEIAGEAYSIRTDATPDYTRECAAFVDRTITEIEGQTALVEAHKAAILAALSLADQLFQARAETASLRDEIARLAGKLAADIETRLAEQGLASRS